MGIFSTSFNIALVYKFLKALVTPFDQTEAYRLGIIDADGNILRKKRNLKTSEEREAASMFERMIWKLKKLLEKLPLGKTKLATYAAALWFIKESEIPHAIRASEKIVGKALLLSESEDNDELLQSGFYILNENVYDLDDDILVKSGERIHIQQDFHTIICGIHVYSALNEEAKLFPVTRNMITLWEEAPTSSAGGGAIAGLGVGPDGEPGMQSHKMLRRREKFAGVEVFKVSNDQFHKSVRGKVPSHRYSRYLGTDEMGEEIRQYGRKNAGKSIILQNDMSGEMVYFKIGKN